MAHVGGQGFGRWITSCAQLRVWGSGFGGLRLQDSGLGVQDEGFGAAGLTFNVGGLRWGGLGLKVGV